MPTNGIHLVLGISGICPFLAAPSAPPPLSFHPLCLLPCPTGVYRFLTSSFLRIRFACILCLSTIATKKRRILCTLYILVCACVFIAECCKITHTQCGSHIPKTALCITLCIMFVLTNYANGMQEMPPSELKQQLHRCFFLVLLLRLCCCPLSCLLH